MEINDKKKIRDEKKTNQDQSIKDREALVRIDCHLNGTSVTLEGFALSRLIDILRGPYGLTGVKEGCGEGECGACTVLIDNEIVNSCLVPLVQVKGTRIETIEGLKDDPLTQEVQRVLVEGGGVQCGMCTPGFVLAMVSLLRKETRPSRERVKKYLSGHLCRCTGYVKIWEALTRLTDPSQHKKKKEGLSERESSLR